MRHCPMCNGAIVPGVTTFTSDVGSGVVVVRHVPADICQQCGEEWMLDAVAERLEAIVDQTRLSGRIVEVIDLQSTVQL